jgi:hypothetical protein
MRFGKVFLAGALVVVAAGCSGHQAGDLSPGATQSRPYAPPPSSASPQMAASARKAANQFSSVYLSRRFAASWDLLDPAAKKLISRDTWIRVHDGCRGETAGSTGVIKSVTVFGNAAIVTEAITKATLQSRTIEAVFNYLHGRWGYSPSDLSIYQHGSISADIAAARTAGYCTGQNKPLL